MVHPLALQRDLQWQRITAWLLRAQHGATKDFGKVLVPDHTPKVKVRSARFEWAEHCVKGDYNWMWLNNCART